MKKILSILLLLSFLGGNFSFGQTATDDCMNNCRKTSLISNPQLTVDEINAKCTTECAGSVATDNPTVAVPEQATTTNTEATPTTTELPKDTTTMGITIGPKCLLNGQCKFNIYDALGIRTSVRNPGIDGQPGDPTSVGLFVQDIVLSATMFIGTVVTLAIIVSGLMRIFAGASGKDPSKAKSGLINSLIGLLIVVSSYLIIRLVQYIAKGF